MTRDVRLVALEGIIASLKAMEDRHPADRMVVMDAVEALLPMLSPTPHGVSQEPPRLRLAA